MASTVNDDEPLPPPPPPPTEEEREEEDDDLEGTRVFGEGAAAAPALSQWAAAAASGLLPPLRSLDLRFSDEVDGAALALLGGHARGLTSLRLDGCRNVVTSSSSSIGSSSALSSSSSSKAGGEKADDDEGDGGGNGDNTKETQHHSAPELAAVLARASKSLRSLSLYWIPRLPPDVVYAAAAACKGLTSLNLSGCTRAVDDGALLAIASSLGGGSKGDEDGGESGGGGKKSSFGGLRRLDLTRCQLQTDRGMAAAFALMPRLRELRLYAVESFGDEAARALTSCAEEEEEKASDDSGDGGGGDDEKGDGDRGGGGKGDKPGNHRGVSRLEVLDVCGARDLSDAAAAELVARRCGGSLRVLGCGWVPNVGDALAKALGRCCSQGSLESLSLHGNRNLSEEGFDALVAGLSGTKKLRALDVRGCVGVREERRSREALREAFGEQLVEFALQR